MTALLEAQADRTPGAVAVSVVATEVTVPSGVVEVVGSEITKAPAAAEGAVSPRLIGSPATPADAAEVGVSVISIWLTTESPSASVNATSNAVLIAWPSWVCSTESPPTENLPSPELSPPALVISMRS